MRSHSEPKRDTPRLRREAITWPECSRHGVSFLTSVFHRLLSCSGMATVLEHPIFSHGEIQNNIEGNPRRNPVEIIDVDAHDEHPASSSLLSQPPPRPRPALRPRHSFHPDAIISLVDDSDDEIEILSDPIPSRHGFLVVFCFFTQMSFFARQ